MKLRRDVPPETMASSGLPMRSSVSGQQLDCSSSGMPCSVLHWKLPMPLTSTESGRPKKW
eukprot:scaffold251899_cov33-Prasinocladus_malaysianus.AAC.1